MGEFMKIPRDVRFALIDSLLASIHDLNRMANSYHSYGGKQYFELAEKYKKILEWVSDQEDDGTDAIQ